MAREHATEESNSTSFASRTSSEPTDTAGQCDATGDDGAIPVTCPECETRWDCEDNGDPACPDCGSAFSVRVRDEFTLVERGGWTVAVSFVAADGQGVVDG